MRWDSSDRQLSALIVDDEPLAREGLRLLLTEHVGSTVIAEAANGLEALTYIRAAKPDVVFLDVQMPEMSGFDVVKDIAAECMPAVVFVTAYDQYAIQAFEINAVDYLLKPVARSRFAQTIQRVLSRSDEHGEIARQITALLQALAAPARYIERVSVRTSGKTQFVNLDDVEWIQAAENYVQLHLRTSRHMLHVPINTLQGVLDPAVFMRIHRSHIVNIRQVKELETAAHGEFVLILHSGARLHSSRTYHDAIKRWATNPF
jgi:two-component system LytT family response regulator